MATHPAWLNTALECQRMGRLAEAEQIYRQVIAANPMEADALHLLGVIAGKREDYQSAGALIMRAVNIKPRRGDFYASLGNLCLAKGMATEMVDCYRRALLFAYFRDIPAPFAQIAAHAGSDPPETPFGNDPTRYKSQCMQDVFLDRWLFEGMMGGVFADVGAHDGVDCSNSYFFESVRGWRGVCIEPNPTVFAKLAENRHCMLQNCCVADTAGTVPFLKISGYAEMLSGIVDKYDPQHRQRVEQELQQFGGSSEVIAIEARRLNDIAKEGGFEEITYLSIDTEGSELSILQSVDFKELMVHVLTVECNFPHVKGTMIDLMRERGFDYAQTLGYDLLFISRKSRFHGVFGRLQNGL